LLESKPLKLKRLESEHNNPDYNDDYYSEESKLWIVDYDKRTRNVIL